MNTYAAGMESDSDSGSDSFIISSIGEPKAKNSGSAYNSFVTQSPSETNSEKLSDNSSYNKYSPKRYGRQPSTGVHTFTRARYERQQNASPHHRRVRPQSANRSQVFDDLRYAILQGNLTITQNLIESKGIHTDTILKSGWTGLMYACSVGHAEIVEYLLKRHANSNYHQDMFTPLMAVCISKQTEEKLLECCSLLLKYNANVNVRDRHHTTPLMFAAREGHAEIVRLLCGHGAEVDAQDSRGYTALAWAAYLGRGHVVRVLLELGADKKKLNHAGQAPVDIAYDRGHEEVASLLQKESIVGVQIEEQKSDEKICNGALNATTLRPAEEPKKYSTLGELEMFLIGVGCQNFIELFHSHHLSFHDLLIMDDEELEKIGIQQVGLRKKILEACKAVHKKEWENSSLPNLKRNQYISCPDAVAMVANIAKHLKYISTSVVYIRNQVQSEPRILELSKEAANVHDLMDEVEESLKNLQTLKDEMRFLKLHLVKVQDKVEYLSADLMIDPDSKQRTYGRIIAAIGVTAASIILAGIWWKHPIQPSIFIRIPFIR